MVRTSAAESMLSVLNKWVFIQALADAVTGCVTIEDAVFWVWLTEGQSGGLLNFLLEARLQEGELFQKRHFNQVKPMISSRGLAFYSSPFFFFNASMSVLDRSNNLLPRPLNKLMPYNMLFGLFARF